MASEVSGVIQQVQRYCQTSEPQEGDDAVQILVQGIFNLLKGLSPVEKWEWVRKIRLEIHKKNSQPERVEGLKKAICIASANNWKDSLLEVNFETKLDLHKIYFQYFNGLDLPFDIDKRSKHFQQTPFQSYLGSTFGTNNPKRIDDKSHHLLDAVFATLCLDSQGRFNGYAMAVADGAGGHIDSKQDENIAQASHKATKSFVRLLSAYEDPENLLKELPAILKEVDKEVQRRGKGESATLVGCRAFPLENAFRIIGCNIGDGMLIAWDPTSHQMHQLLPAHATSAGTALIPGAYKPFELYTLDHTLPVGCQLFLMTDGVHDSLPFHEVEDKYPNDLLYNTRTLTKLEKQLKTAKKAPLKVIFKKMFAGIEAERQKNMKKPDTQIGDDFTILQCSLNK